VEMIQDRSFDAMALALGFKPGNATVPLRPPGADPARSHHHHYYSRRLAAAAAEAERLPLCSGVVAGLASMFSMPLPLGFGQHEGAFYPSPCNLPHCVLFRANLGSESELSKHIDCVHTSGRGSLGLRVGLHRRVSHRDCRCCSSSSW